MGCQWGKKEVMRLFLNQKAIFVVSSSLFRRDCNEQCIISWKECASSGEESGTSLKLEEWRKRGRGQVQRYRWWHKHMLGEWVYGDRDRVKDGQLTGRSETEGRNTGDCKGLDVLPTRQPGLFKPCCTCCFSGVNIIEVDWREGRLCSLWLRRIWAATEGGELKLSGDFAKEQREWDRSYAMSQPWLKKESEQVPLGTSRVK